MEQICATRGSSVPASGELYRSYDNGSIETCLNPLATPVAWGGLVPSGARVAVERERWWEAAFPKLDET